MRQMQRFVIVAVATAVFAVAGCSAASGQERGNQAWSQRLTGQALEAQQAARRDQARLAWAQRLTEQAVAYATQQDAERAKHAWAERLTKLAEYVEAGGTIPSATEASAR
jgi:hypothetical protein